MGLRDYIGGHKRKIVSPDSFGVGTLGESWGNYLKGLYAEDTQDSAVYRSQSSALRDALSMESEGQQDQFTQAASAGGFYDSGARLTGLNEINRNRMMSYSQGLSGILTNLENQKLTAAFPFISARLSEWQAVEEANYRQDELQTQRKKQIAQTVGSIFGSASSMGNQQQNTGT